MEKLTAKFILRSGQTIVCVMKKPLKEIIKFPISGYDFEFKYSFAVVTGGEYPKIDAVYYHQRIPEEESP